MDTLKSFSKGTLWLVTVIWNGCHPSTKLMMTTMMPITYTSRIWLNWNVQSLISSSNLILRKKSFWSRMCPKADFCVHTPLTVLICVGAVISMPAIVECNVPRDAVASMMPLGRRMSLHVPMEIRPISLFSYPWTPLRFTWMAIITDISDRPIFWAGNAYNRCT